MKKNCRRKFALLACISTVLSASQDTSYLFPLDFIFFRKSMEVIQVWFNTVIVILSNEQNDVVCCCVWVLILSRVLLVWLGPGISFWTHYL